MIIPAFVFVFMIVAIGFIVYCYVTPIRVVKSNYNITPHKKVLGKGRKLEIFVDDVLTTRFISDGLTHQVQYIQTDSTSEDVQ